MLQLGSFVAPGIQLILMAFKSPVERKALEDASLDTRLYKRGNAGLISLRKRGNRFCDVLRYTSARPRRDGLAFSLLAVFVNVTARR
jgi:hypothetical protein